MTKIILTGAHGRALSGPLSRTFLRPNIVICLDLSEWPPYLASVGLTLASVLEAFRLLLDVV